MLNSPNVIDELLRRAASNGAISLGGGLPADELFPRGALARAFLRSVGRRGGGALQYGWPEGDEALRAWIASRLASRGANVTKEDVVITSGAQQALAIASEILLDPGDDVLVEDRTYPGALDVFRRLGADATSFEGANASCAYVMPGVSNPAGAALDPKRIDDLLGRRIHIIADEAYGELRFDGATPPLLLKYARDRVWHVGTFSKTLCPGLRVGWLVPPPLFAARVRAMKHDVDLEAGSLSQAILSTFLATDAFDARLARTRRFYEARAHKLMRALRRRFPHFRFAEPEGGFSIFVETDQEGDEVALLEAAVQHGVSFDPGSMFHPERAPSPVSFRLTFSSIAPLWIDEGVARLERAWKSWSKEQRVTRRAAPRTTDIRSLVGSPEANASQHSLVAARLPELFDAPQANDVVAVGAE